MAQPKVRCICDDVECKFRYNSRSHDKIEFECALTTHDAIMFFERYKLTTCEVGLQQELIGNSVELTRNIIRMLKYNGRMGGCV